jgi:hypothetical protein
MNDEYGKFNLLRFTSKEDLTSIVQAFCDLTNVSGGVVSMPEDPDKPPTDEKQFHKYRLTVPEVVHQYSFCRYVRACSAGNVKCMWSDLHDAQAALAAGRAISYKCHLGLVDTVAPIMVAGRHVANV